MKLARVRIALRKSAPWLIVAARVTAEFPTWSPEQGLCGRCLETYQAAAKLGEPPVLAATT